MEIYIPYHDHNRWNIQTADGEETRRIGSYWEYRGTIYGLTAYTTYEGAQAYIEKRYHEAEQSEYRKV